jgi:hypothetical protein
MKISDHAEIVDAEIGAAYGVASGVSENLFEDVSATPNYPERRCTRPNSYKWRVAVEGESW